jgi:ribosomal 50S subunit-recycling heat shock protein
VEAGDVLSFTAPSGSKLVRIISLPERRGPPAEAALCYEALVGR